ncbi:MAG: hypothetical protein F6K11_26715 [Leptolyngbya sp. SIO3F4]|nr:hypothetical protein [Leptolyngbya sp. SIO3F4]
MSSLCKPASPTQPLQGIMLDGLVRSPKSQHKEKIQRGKQRTHSIYWTDELAISEASSTLSPYYTALALGTTVVCSAGALMHYTTPGVWHQSDNQPSDQTVAQSKQSETATSVVTPPIATSQTAASFSPRTDSTACSNGTCKGSKFANRRISLQAQLQALRAEREQLQVQHSAHQLQTQQAILSHRSDDLVNRQTALAQRTQKLNQQFDSLTHQLALHPKDVEQIENLLNEDTSYQVNRLRLSGLKDAIAIEYSKPVLDNPQLEVLYGQYAQELEQLRQIAQTVLADYITYVSAEFPNPLWHDDEYYSQLQKLMDVTHLRQMQIVEHNTLAQMQAQLNHQRKEVAVLLEKNNPGKALRVS